VQPGKRLGRRYGPSGRVVWRTDVRPTRERLRRRSEPLGRSTFWRNFGANCTGKFAGKQPNYWRFAVVVALLLVWFPNPRGVAAEQAIIKNVRITPKYETAGLIVEADAVAVALEILSPNGYQSAHPFVRFDQRHFASSLFGLDPGTEYTVRIAGTSVHHFRTQEEFQLPRDGRVIHVDTMDALQRAADSATPGATILVAPGVYRGRLVVRRSGEAGKPIVIRGNVESRSVPVWERKDLPVIDATNEETGILLDGARHIVLDGLQVRNARKHGVYLLRASYCVVQRMQIYDNGTWNLIISKGGPASGRHLIQDNHVADMKHGRFLFDYRGSSDVTYYGIIQDNQPGWGTTIRRNRVEGHIDGIVPSGDEHELKGIGEHDGDVVSKGFNGEVDVYDNLIFEQRDDAIEADGVIVNLRIFRNTIRLAQNGSSIAPTGPGPVFFVRNIFSDYAESGVKVNTGEGRGLIRNVFYYHNTFMPWEFNERAILTIWGGTPSKNVVFRNNIFGNDMRAVSARGLLHPLDMDYDLWHAQGTDAARQLFEDAGLRWEDHGVFADPRFGSDFALTARSPAVDRGTRLPGINDGYAGRGPDIGAREFNPKSGR